MDLRLVRRKFSTQSTIGDLYADGEPLGIFTLEDFVRPAGEKVPGKTAIPYGTYEVTITWSNRFKKPLPLLMNVPMFEGIRIHPGNTAENTEGCLLVGETEGEDFIGNSRIAFEKLFPKIQEAILTGKVHIEITQG